MKGVLDWLGIPAANPAAVVWLAEARKLHTYAHRVRMEQTPMDAAVRVRLAELEDMLDVVLDRFETRYVTVLQRLETLAAVREPGKAHVKLLLNAFPQDYLTQERFFGLLDAPGGCRTCAGTDSSVRRRHRKPTTKRARWSFPPGPPQRIWCG